MAKLRQWALLVTYGVALGVAVLNYDRIVSAASAFWRILNPITYGLVMAYLLSFVMDALERYPLKGMARHPRLRLLQRPLAITISLGITFLIIYAFFAVMIPELGASFLLLRQRAPELSASFTSYINGLLDYYQLTDIFWVELQSALSAWATQMIQWVTDILPILISRITRITSAVMDIAIGLIISVHLLASRDILKEQITRLVGIYSDSSRISTFTEIGQLVAQSFNNYIYVRVLESFIIYFMMIASMLLIGAPYVNLVATVTALTNLIPVIGPILATFPCFFLIAVIDPDKAFLFVVVHVVVQQVEGNIIGPQISGSALGLPSLWVLVSIILGGGLLGGVGLFIGPPVMTIIFELANRFILAHEAKKKKAPANLNREEGASLNQ
ncbi:MAG: AI-2E family transporter [Symbiobacteriaceae bacterium]|nr:AI-2E family transporter [Symbiobacteriaceae bacterium]